MVCTYVLKALSGKMNQLAKKINRVEWKEACMICV